MDLIFYLVLLLVLVVFVVAFGWPFFRGAPYAVSDRTTVSRMVDLMQPCAGRRIADLGSGDGRLIIALAAAGAEAHGYEINPLLVWWSRFKLRRAGLSQLGFIHRQSYWGADLGPYDGIVAFGVPYIMKKMEQKLQSELKPGATVIVNRYAFPSWAPLSSDRGISVYKR